MVLRMRSGFFAFLVVAACGGNNSSQTPDAPAAPDAAIDAGFTPASHLPPPQVVSLGGPVLTAPKIEPIFFTGDSAMQGMVEGFLSTLATDPYWAATTSEYGVGALTILPTIVTTSTPPTTDAALQTWLTTMTDGTHAGWPTPDMNTVYAVYLPAGVVLSTPFGTSCQSFGGYHDETVTTMQKPLIYALLPRCDSSLTSQTVVTSHELVEAATDPLPFTKGAWQSVDNDHAIWGFTPGGELGDMCEYVHAAEQQIVGSYTVQRTWSNASAAAGHDPCVPALKDPYVTATPMLTDSLPIDIGPPQGTVMTKGISVAMGTSKTIEVDLWSDAPT